MVNNDFLICYNFLPLATNHALDASEKFYEGWGVKRLHEHEPFDPLDVEQNDVIFVKTDFIVNDTFRQGYMPMIDCNFSLVTGNSSFHIGRDGGDAYKEILNNPKLKKWYCTNPPDIENEKIVPLPIGFEEPARAGGNQAVLNRCRLERKQIEDKEELVFLPYHTVNTNPNRAESLKYLNNLSFVTSQSEKMVIEKYLKTMDCYKFIICLEGSGPDTHRNYESLLVGSVPIMKDSTIKKVFEYYKLPGIFVDSWEQINDTFFNRIKNMDFDFSNVENFLRAKTHIESIKSVYEN